MPATDSFSSESIELDSPSSEYEPITPHNVNELAKVTRGLIVANGGLVKVTRPDGVAVTIEVPAGQFALRVKQVWATGTTATGFTALY